MKYFICSDVHSFYTAMMTALSKAGFDINNPEHILCIVGDAFDRGSETRQMFEFMKKMQAQGKLRYIRGNHEKLLDDCVHDIFCGKIPGYHHFSNGTVKTICQFCGESEWIIYDPAWRDKICETMQPVLDFINENCVNYAEIGSYILCHGWVPCGEGANNFRNASDAEWQDAAWLNGMKMWYRPYNRVDGHTVVCGHWHANYGHAYIHEVCSEWGEDAIFEPFIDDGIIALDSAVAYSGKVNVFVIEDGKVYG